MSATPNSPFWLLLLAPSLAACASARPPTKAAATPNIAAPAATTAPAPPAVQPSTPPLPRDDPYWAMDRCPPEMALVGRVCIDRWEASLVEMLANGQLRPWSPFVTPTGKRVRLMAVSKPGVVPQGYINGIAAARACDAAGKRLCSAGEWELACRGPEAFRYPYGSERQEAVCNDDGRGRHPVAEAGRRLGKTLDEMWRSGMDEPIINQLKDTVEKTGAHPACSNSYGAFDMVGNLHEWIADPDGTFRGGFFMDTKINGEGCAYATTAHSTRYHDYSIGFRCCKDVQTN